jgi:hypothetical protein
MVQGESIMKDFADMKDIATLLGYVLKPDAQDSDLVALWQGNYCARLGSASEVGEFLTDGLVVHRGVKRNVLDRTLAKREEMAEKINELPLDLDW